MASEQPMGMASEQSMGEGLREPGSEVLAELIKTYNPRLALVGGAEPAH